MIDDWASVHAITVLKSRSFFNDIIIVVGNITLHHVLLSVIDASESDSLASASLVSVSIDGGAAEADLSSLDVSANGDVIHDSTGLGRVIPVVRFVCAHVFEGESTVEVLADVTTNVLSQDESATWVIEEILLHVNDEVIDDCDLMA